MQSFYSFTPPCQKENPAETLVSVESKKINFLANTLGVAKNKKHENHKNNCVVKKKILSIA